MIYAGPRNIEIMSFEEYAQLSVRAPYILNIHARKGHLLYFGAEHTYDPTHPQLSELEKLWKDFHPTIAFHEGRGQAEEKSRKEAVARHGEAGIVWFLAARNGIPVRSIEPYRADEVSALLQHFSGERIKLFYILRQVTQHRRMRKVEPLDDYTNKILFKLSKIQG